MEYEKTYRIDLDAEQYETLCLLLDSDLSAYGRYFNARVDDLAGAVNDASVDTTIAL